MNRDDAPKSESLRVFGPNGECLTVPTKAVEEPGRYFPPLLGVLITGAARLMLGISEKKTLDGGLDWTFCDTDSLAIVRPPEMPRENFHEKVKAIVDWFEPLNPYKKPGSILKPEKLNFGIRSKKYEPLYCFAISSKRYVLFNVRGVKPIVRKASAHGLGHLMDPYSEEDTPAKCPAPRVSLAEIGVKRWHHDLWVKILQAALDGKPDQVVMGWHPALFKAAALRYTASNPELLAWLEAWNRGKPYHGQIRPFGFLLSLTPRSGVFLTRCAQLIVDSIKRGRPRELKAAPIAPYNGDAADSLSGVFDRVTGEAVRTDQLKTYAEVLAQYHLSCEEKFLNGRFRDRGRTERRHVVATEFAWIGKEANRVGDSGEIDPTNDPVVRWSSYGGSRGYRARMAESSAEPN